MSENKTNNEELEKQEKIKENSTEQVLEVEVLDGANVELPDEKRITRKVIVVLVVLLIFTIGTLILYSNWNVLWGYQNCKSGDYETAIKYYAQEINKGKADNNIRIRYDALSAYVSAQQAYDSDDMGTMSQCLDFLKTTQSMYPTKEEVSSLQTKYKKRSNEIISYDKSISEIVELFSDVTKMETIKSKCDELGKKNVTAAQKAKLTDIKSNAINYIDIKSSYDKTDYAEVVKKFSELPETYKSYATKDSIEKMKNEAQKILDERELINTKLKSARDSFNGGNYDNSLDIANELLPLNLTVEERKEVEIIKSTSEQKIAEEKAAAEQAAREARQKLIDSAIKISATALYEEFNTNKVGAEAKYKDKMLLVTGTVYKIDDTWLFDEPYIELQAGYVADGVFAYFSPDDASQVVDLRQGQTVKVLGKCVGYSLGLIKLFDCSIVN